MPSSKPSTLHIPQVGRQLVKEQSGSSSATSCSISGVRIASGGGDGSRGSQVDCGRRPRTHPFEWSGLLTHHDFLRVRGLGSSSGRGSEFQTPTCSCARPFLFFSPASPLPFPPCSSIYPAKTSRCLSSRRLRTTPTSPGTRLSTDEGERERPTVRFPFAALPCRRQDDGADPPPFRSLQTTRESVS